MHSLSARRPLWACALLLVAQTAQAEVTPADVWEDWRSYISGMGSALTATETVSGDSLIISDLRVELAMPEDQGSGFMSIGTLTFTANGDGTVDIVMPDALPITMSMTADDGTSLSYAIDYVNSGFRMTASGTPVALEYAYSAESVGLVLQSLIIDGETVPAEDAAFAASLMNIAGTTQTVVESLRNYTQAMSADRMEYELIMNVPDEGGKLAMSGSSTDLRFAGTGAVPLAVAQSPDMGDMLSAGFAVDGTFTFGPGQSAFSTLSPEGEVDAQTTSQGGALGVKMSADGITYDVSQTGLTVDMRTDAAPFPISFAMENSKFNLTMPLQKSDEAQDFGVGLTLGGFTVPEMLWSIIDPGSQLPRDPATVALDLTGKGRLLFDFLDPAAAAMSGDPDITPAEVESLNINTLQVKIAGAELTGTGAFTFENAETGGMPKPTGEVNLQLSGGNALLDKLVAMGLLPEDQAMGARMMMGLFAVPGDAPDTLNSKIEVNDQGHVIANGQRIQ